MFSSEVWFISVVTSSICWIHGTSAVKLVVILNLLSFCINIVCSWVELSKIGSPSSRVVTFTPDKKLVEKKEGRRK
jgi:hypothetical protein